MLAKKAGAVMESLKANIMEVLETVKDPEMTTVSVLDLGMIEEVEVSGSSVRISVLPTFLGCPALDIIHNNVKTAAEGVAGIEHAEVIFIKHPAWTSDRITKEGREHLKEFGIAPPPEKVADDGMWQVECPYCESPYTAVENLFGPTACRSILYCKSCRNPFEAMKPMTDLSMTGN
ncbi:1,2-phenylacetyl-CoA epoxidase subunit PaaD [Bacillus marinisedimentorum]|uniref:1,2-phenylacetyl-CoA epoxidase subunit PaaD n=1 Tax=Bacillus marinisedimentorum TaxID=1821260 RepID=UPI001FE0ECDF|nr:1,2-phenylacetyl-CoA epoxidase subunit PaaD [Bacillus marinisedimentorum]